jgi:hypothetical protein
MDRGEAMSAQGVAPPAWGVPGMDRDEVTSAQGVAMPARGVAAPYGATEISAAPEVRLTAVGVLTPFPLTMAVCYLGGG